MEWKEFQEQAYRDLLSCKILRKENDFGNAVYLLQQSLEKYVKAYVFKYKIFVDNPKRLGHQPLKALFRELSNNTERIVRQSTNTQTKIMFSKLDSTIKVVIELFNNIKDPDDPTLRIAIWKDSLGLPLNDKEKSILKELKVKWSTNYSSEISDIVDMFSVEIEKLKKLAKDPIKKQIVDKQLESTIGLSFDMILKILTELTENFKNLPENMNLDLGFLENMINALAQISSKNSSQNEFMKYIRSAWIFSLRNEIIQTFAHEDIGRYPTDIDGKSSLIIYAQRVSELDKLIDNVENTCKKINDVLMDKK